MNWERHEYERSVVYSIKTELDNVKYILRLAFRTKARNNVEINAYVMGAYIEGRIVKDCIKLFQYKCCPNTVLTAITNNKIRFYFWNGVHKHEDILDNLIKANIEKIKLFVIHEKGL
jgi:hypothetical protein